MRKDYSICFSKEYSKLEHDSFHTVRWLDSEYVLGKSYQVSQVSKGGCYGFRRVKDWGKARLVKMEIKKMIDLSKNFIQTDADCSPTEFYGLMHGWYSKKPDWDEWNSEIQILYFEKIKV